MNLWDHRDFTMMFHKCNYVSKFKVKHAYHIEVVCLSTVRLIN